MSTSSARVLVKIVKFNICMDNVLALLFIALASGQPFSSTYKKKLWNMAMLSLIIATSIIVPSAVAALAVSLSQCQNGKITVMKARKKELGDGSEDSEPKGNH